MENITLNTRNADLSDLAKILVDQQAAKHDIVVPASKIRAVGGNVLVDGDGMYRPTAVADEGIADKLGVPVAYLKRLRTERPDLYDANVNGWLHGFQGWIDPMNDENPVGGIVAGDARSFLLRTFKGDTSADHVARAFLSQNFKLIDNLDVLTAALEGVRESGVPIEVVGCDLTERNMSVKIACPSVTALAPKLLEGYRTPFGDGRMRRAGNGDTMRWGLDAAAREGMGYEPGTEPIVFGGFIISNSETGNGRFKLTPRILVKICRNGLTVPIDALSAVHLGGKMDEGVVKWSDDTQQKNIELITSQAKDAVKTFLDVEYVQSVVADIEAKAGASVTDGAKTIEVIGKQLRFSDEQVRDTLNAFILGGQMTAGGVLNAVTAMAQTVEDADVANDIEAQAMRVLEMAAAN